jgi:hypothetical protein
LDTCGSPQRSGQIPTTDVKKLADDVLGPLGATPGTVTVAIDSLLFATRF